MARDPYEFELQNDTPEGWKQWRDMMFKAYASVPVPPGVEDLPDQPPRPPNTVIAADGSQVRYYVTPRGTTMATLVHPEGYAEFYLIDGTWQYASVARILMQYLDYFDADEIEVDQVSVEPPTLAIAQTAAQADPTLKERAAQLAAQRVHDEASQR